MGGMANHEKYPLPATYGRRLIGERIKLVRVARGYDRANALCAALGFSPSMYSQWETGGKLPNTPDLVRFCHLTGATTDYILTGNMAGLPFELARLLGQDGEGRKSA